MDSERYRRVKEHFLAAAELSTDARAAYLGALGEDAPLREEIESLLRADDSVSGLDLGREAVAPAPVASPLLAGAPRSEIGGYRIVRVLGHGGMGAVFEAEQDTPRRRVALKVIRAEVAAPAALRRFELEAEILGRLEHEGIARIYEAGLDRGENGDEPFIAMELVEGKAVDEYVRENALGPHAILELVETIARAVSHAHQRGIVHRDLKPANVLVTCDGRPKVLDFGISRLAVDAMRASPGATLAGQILGTLAYMSPEQAAGTPDDIDTRSDVYSLGVMAYELLAGRLPCELPRASLAATVDAIRNEIPEPLHRVIGGIDRDAALIVHRALEKDKERRYGSAAALADDIRRWLDHMPIAARPASASYHLRKFARRHRVLVAGVAATFFALVAGIVATGLARADEAEARRHADARAADAVREMKAAEEARGEANRARREAEERLTESLRVFRFFNRVLGTAQPQSLGRGVTLGDALRHVAANLQREFGDDPKYEAAVRLALGKTCDSAAMRVAARRNLEQALALREANLPAGDVLVAEARHELGRHHLRAGELDDAEVLIEDALEVFRRHLPRYGEAFASSLLDLAALRSKLAGAQEAAALWAEGVEAVRRFGAADPEALVTALNGHGSALRAQGRMDEAEGAFAEARSAADAAARTGAAPPASGAVRGRARE